MIQVYAAADVHAALPWAPLVRALEAAFIDAGAQVPLRHAHALSADDTLLLMPAWNARIVVVKLVTVMPSAPASVQATVLAMDRATGAPLALIDGAALTWRRTAATSALAAQHLAQTDARTLLIVGTGHVAAGLARAHAALRPQLDRIVVWGRRAEGARALVETLARDGLPAEAGTDLEAAVRAAHIISSATTSKEPLVQGAWLAPGTHLDLVGSFRPDMREADDDAVQRANVVVDTYAGALAEAGELVQAIERGAIARGHVRAELAQVLRGERKGRSSDDEITLFKSVGTALEDLAAAQLALGIT
jgi:ornithine cyclodeaminase